MALPVALGFGIASYFAYSYFTAEAPRVFPCDLARELREFDVSTLNKVTVPPPQNHSDLQFVLDRRRRLVE